MKPQVKTGHKAALVTEATFRFLPGYLKVVLTKDLGLSRMMKRFSENIFISVAGDQPRENRG
jgi:hypothetical protein